MIHKFFFKGDTLDNLPSLWSTHGGWVLGLHKGLSKTKSFPSKKAVMSCAKITCKVRAIFSSRHDWTQSNKNTTKERSAKGREECHIVRPPIWSMTDGHSSSWTIVNAIVPQHHNKARGIAGVSTNVLYSTTLYRYDTVQCVLQYYLFSFALPAERMLT